MIVHLSLPAKVWVQKLKKMICFPKYLAVWSVDPAVWRLVRLMKIVKTLDYGTATSSPSPQESDRNYPSQNGLGETGRHFIPCFSLVKASQGFHHLVFWYPPVHVVD